MKTYAAVQPSVLISSWLNRVRHGLHEAVVTANSTVEVYGVELLLRGAEVPSPGTVVQVWLNGSGFFACATLDEIEREENSRRDAEAAEAARRRQKLNAMRMEAEAINGRIALPVRWDVGIKDVLSGLSESSFGDGRSKATVEHIYLLEPLVAGRLTRRKGDFLCTAASGTNGKHWSSKIVGPSHDGEGRPYQTKVTCKACLTLASRWMTS